MKRLSDIRAQGCWLRIARVLEGINNTIKLIKRMTCFFLKLQAAFPGI